MTKPKISLADLTEVGTKTGTDKATYHGYTGHYQEILGPYVEGSPGGSLVELGFLHGASARMWREWLPRTWTVDIVEINPVPDEALVNNVMVWQGSQGDSDIPRALNEQMGGHGFDIVIDDASHEMSLTEAAFRAWWKYVKPGGWYIIEDCVTSALPAYGGGKPRPGGRFQGGLGIGQLAVPGVLWAHPDGPEVLRKVPVTETGRLLVEAGGKIAEMRVLPNMVWLRKAPRLVD